MIVNIRGTSGSGKSTLVKRFLNEHEHEPIEAQLGIWKKPKVVAYKVTAPKEPFIHYSGFVRTFEPQITYVIGRYETQCGGCDALSYKGSHEDIEEMVRLGAAKGNVIFEGLTISSTLTRWQRISDDFPGQFVWAFMMTPVEECYRRILARSGREPKRNDKGIADHQIKYAGCIRHINQLKLKGEQVLELTSDDAGYQKLLEGFGVGAPTLT